MSRPEEFKITIEPDGRITLERGSMTEDSYKKILDFLQETIGPVQAGSESDPIEGRIQTRGKSQAADELKLGPR